jgi:alpha-amylase
MNRQRSFLKLFFFAFIVFYSCNSAGTGEQNKVAQEVKLIDGHPDWIMQGNIYEVNIRQYTPEGSFKAFEKQLDRLKDMGVQTLWFMPIHPIGKVDRKGTLGSYYAVGDYKAVNPEFGTMQDWKDLVNAAHQKGFKVIIDWVPNHTAADHPWLTSHADFYKKDSLGKPTWKFDWTDIRVLDFSNKEMQDSMTAAMNFWVAETDIDGFRCDHVEKYQDEFWKRTITELNKTKKVFMLAEGEGSWIFNVGFDMDYGWSLFHKTVSIAAGRTNALAIDTIMKRFDSAFPKNALQLLFTSNHDENSWNRADYGTMPGDVHAPFAVLTQTLPKGTPLIYSGQEEPILRNISFFEKDTIKFEKLSRAPFYRTLLHLRKDFAPLASNASFKKISAGDDKAVYAFVREAGGKKLLVVLNLSPKLQSIKITDNSLHGSPFNIFSGGNESISDQPSQMKPWGYAVYKYE